MSIFLSNQFSKAIVVLVNWNFTWKSRHKCVKVGGFINQIFRAFRCFTLWASPLGFTLDSLGGLVYNPDPQLNWISGDQVFVISTPVTFPLLTNFVLDLRTKSLKTTNKTTQTFYRHFVTFLFHCFTLFSRSYK